MLSSQVTASLCMSSLTTIWLAYLMPLLVYNYIVKYHQLHMAHMISVGGTHTNTRNPCRSRTQFSLLWFGLQ
jgi:hypothetical protein